jgi:phage terminase large subunit-like protein
MVAFGPGFEYQSLEQQVWGMMFQGLAAELEFQPEEWCPHPYQVRPEGEWEIWVVLGGRGSGKTRTGTEEVIQHLREFGPNAMVGVGGPTIAAARDVCAEGKSGIITKYGHEFTKYNRSLGEAYHRDGGHIKFLGSERPARWNGPQWSMLWLDELALWIEESFHQAMFGLRLGDDPRALATTTPKRRKFVRDLCKEPTTVVTHGTTEQNTNLSAKAKARLYRRYAGTNLGRQELQGLFLEDTEGALWNHKMIDRTRVNEPPRHFTRIVVGVDPAVTSNKKSNETGIIVAALAENGHAYILRDATLSGMPKSWAKKVVRVYSDYEADRIVAEINNGGDLVETVIRVIDPNVNYRGVHAMRGKYVRAEPVAGLYEQGRVHHVGVLGDLEDQMCEYVPHEYEGSPDRMDALVWCLYDLMMHGDVPLQEAVRW